MSTRRLIVFISIILCCSGCFSSVPKQTPPAADLSGSPTGKIINRDVFAKGGTLVVLPFKAGEDVVASPQLDRMAMMIAKGAIDYLNEQKTPFTVLTTQDQGSPELVVEGYIEDMDRPGKLGRLVLRHKKATLRVNGQIIVAATKERVMIFQSTKSMADPKRDGLDIAYQTGQDLGRFIVDALNEG